MVVNNCRLCNKIETKLIDVFDNITDDVYLAQKISLCFGVQIREDDPITKCICKTCYFFTSTVYEHRIASLETNAKLWKEYRHLHPNTEIKPPDLKCASKPNSYLPKNISQGDFLNSLNLSHKTKIEHHEIKVHDSVRKIRQIHPKLKFDKAYEHVDFDPFVALDRTDCYYDCNTTPVNPNFGIWSVNNDLKDSIGILLKRIKRSPKRRLTNSFESGYGIAANEKLEHSASSLTSTSVSNVSLDSASKDVIKKRSTKQAVRLNGRFAKKNNTSTTTNSDLPLISDNDNIIATINSVIEESLKQTERQEELSSIEVQIKKRKLVLELPKVDQSEFSHIYRKALKNCVNQPDSDAPDTPHSETSDNYILEKTYSETLNVDKQNNKNLSLSQGDNLFVSVDKSQETFICQTCNKVFDTLQLLKSHKRYNHKSSSLRCTECSKRFTVVENLMKHKESHLPKKGKININLKDLLASSNSIMHDALRKTIPNHTLRSVARKSTGGVLDFLRSNTFSETNILLSADHVTKSDTKTRFVARKSTGGAVKKSSYYSPVTQSTGGGIGNPDSVEANIDAGPTEIFANVENDITRNGTSSGDSVQLENAGFTSLDIVPAMRIVARKSTGGVLKPFRDIDSHELELIISSDDDDTTEIEFVNGSDEPVHNQDETSVPAITETLNDDSTTNTKQLFKSNSSLLELALQPQLPDTEDQEPVEKSEETVEVIDDSDVEEDVIFVPNEESILPDDPTKNSSNDKHNSPLVKELCVSVPTKHQLPTTPNNTLHSNEALKQHASTSNETRSNNTKITNETNFINYVFNKCIYNNGNIKNATNEKWVLNGIQRIIEKSPVAIKIVNTSEEHISVQYKRTTKTITKRSNINPWNPAKPIDIPKRTLPNSHKTMQPVVQGLNSPPRKSTSESSPGLTPVVIMTNSYNKLPSNTNEFIPQYQVKLMISNAPNTTTTQSNQLITSQPLVTSCLLPSTPYVSKSLMQPKPKQQNVIQEQNKRKVTRGPPSYSNVSQQSPVMIALLKEPEVSQGTQNIIDTRNQSPRNQPPQKRIGILRTKTRAILPNPDTSTAILTPIPTSVVMSNSSQQMAGQVSYINGLNVMQTNGQSQVAPNLLPTNSINSIRVDQTNQQISGPLPIPSESRVIQTYNNQHIIVPIQIPPNVVSTAITQTQPISNLTAIRNYRKQNLTGLPVSSSLLFATNNPAPTTQDKPGPVILNETLNCMQTSGNPYATLTSAKSTTNSSCVIVSTSSNSNNSEQVVNGGQSYGIQQQGLNNLSTSTNPTTVVWSNTNQHNSGQANSISSKVITEYDQNPLNKSNVIGSYGNQYKNSPASVLPITTNRSQLLMSTNLNEQISRLNESAVIQTNGNQHVPTSLAPCSSQLVMLSQFHQESVGLLTVQQTEIPETLIPTTVVGISENSDTSEKDASQKPTIRIKSLMEINSSSADVSRYELHSTYVQTLTKYVTENPNTVNETCTSNGNEYLQIS